MFSVDVFLLQTRNCTRETKGRAHIVLLLHICMRLLYLRRRFIAQGSFLQAHHRPLVRQVVDVELLGFGATKASSGAKPQFAFELGACPNQLAFIRVV